MYSLQSGADKSVPRVDVLLRVNYKGVTRIGAATTGDQPSTQVVVWLSKNNIAAVLKMNGMSLTGELYSNFMGFLLA